MSLDAFSNVIQSQVYKNWLKELDKNIITSTVKDLRKKEQLASKTDFLISVNDIKNMYKNITNTELTNARAKTVLRKIAQKRSQDIPATAVRVNRSGGLLFETIGFDTISDYVKDVFDELDGVQEAYELAREKFIQDKQKENAALPKAKQKSFSDIEKQAASIGFGYFVHKGHVVSVAANTAKEFRKKLLDAQELEETNRKMLVGILDNYIAKLQEDDLASANLPNAHKQEIYAKYTKDSTKYLVELQFSSTNMEAGSASLPIVNELRKLFDGATSSTINDLNKSNTLGLTLFKTKSSPSMLEMGMQELASILATGKTVIKSFNLPKTKLQEKTRKIDKKSNRGEISKLKALKSKVNNRPKIKVPSEVALGSVFKEATNLTSLQNLINANLAEKIKENMGGGSSRTLLNNRTGRLAESAQVERMSESRAGMITAFYSYMKNPYATFSAGGRQQDPKSRDPKLLIAKSIREIAAQQVGNRLRSVLV